MSCGCLARRLSRCVRHPQPVYQFIMVQSRVSPPHEFLKSMHSFFIICIFHAMEIILIFQFFISTINLSFCRPLVCLRAVRIQPKGDVLEVVLFLVQPLALGPLLLVFRHFSF